MPKPKTDTLVFKQTVSNIQYKKLLRLAQNEGLTIQDVVRSLILTATANILLNENK
jgi:hypothetical protein